MDFGYAVTPLRVFVIGELCTPSFDPLLRVISEPFCWNRNNFVVVAELCDCVSSLFLQLLKILLLLTNSRIHARDCPIVFGYIRITVILTTAAIHRADGT